jgi:hypothetical protein
MPEDNPTWREVHSLMDAKVVEIRREQDDRYKDVNSKLDRNADKTERLANTLESELRKITQLLYEAKQELTAANASSDGIEKYKQWIIPTLVSIVLVIIEALHLMK